MQRYFAKEKNDDLFLLEKTDLHHIKNVMRMNDGDEIEVVYNETPYLCKVFGINDNIKIKLVQELEKKKQDMPKVNLIIPLLKEQKMDLILQKATELGVHEITPIFTKRSIIKIDSKKENSKLDRWKRICKEASEQSFRDSVPIINKIVEIGDLTLKDVNIVCSTVEKAKNVRNILKTVHDYDTINIVIGPEGGLSLEEEQLLQKMGFSSVTLGSRIMRVETVPLFILSVINYEFMR